MNYIPNKKAVGWYTRLKLYMRDKLQFYYLWASLKARRLGISQSVAKVTTLLTVFILLTFIALTTFTISAIAMVMMLLSTIVTIIVRLFSKPATSGI